MRDAPLPNVDSVDDDGIDETIQRRWDHFAASDQIGSAEPGSPLAAFFRRLTNETKTTEFDSPRADEPTTTFADVSATAESADVADDTDLTEPAGQWELREGFS